MKQFAIVVMFVGLFSVAFAQLPEAEKKAIRDASIGVKGKKITPIRNADTDAVFKAKFYRVSGQIVYKLEKGSSIEHEYLFISFENTYVNPEKVNVSARGGKVPDKKTPTLMRIINPSFKIKTMADAVRFEKALSVMYPYSISRFDEKKILGKSKIYKIDDEWFFVRRTFFKDIEGFAVTVDKTGTISDIRYSYYLNPPAEPDKDDLDVPQALKKELLAKYAETLKVEPRAVNSAAVKAAFGVSFYRLQAVLEDYDDGSRELNYGTMYKQGNTYHKLANPRWGAQSLKRVPQLEKLLSKTFVIKNETQAKTLGDALATLMSESSRRAPRVEISKNGDDWSIAFNVRFSGKVGYTVTVNEDGSISKIMCNPRLK